VASLANEPSVSPFHFQGESVINHPDIVAEIAHQHHAEMIAAAEEFRRAKQVRRLRKPRRKLRRPFMRSKWIRAGLDERADGSVCELRP
jgi:hypothetical protein